MKLILGHLGETIPYVLSRIDESLSRDTPMKKFREVFTSHFYVTTSGFFSDPALRCCVDEMGIDRVMFSVDWPFVSNKDGVDWLRNNYLGPVDREKDFFSGNAEEAIAPPGSGCGEDVDLRALPNLKASMARSTILDTT